MEAQQHPLTQSIWILQVRNFPKTRNRNKYIMIVKCAVSRWKLLTIAKVLYTCKNNFRSRNWIRKPINETTRHFYTGNRRSNYCVENHNRVLKSMLSQYVNAYQTDRDDYLPLCRFQYKPVTHSSSWSSDEKLNNRATNGLKNMLNK